MAGTAGSIGSKRYNGAAMTIHWLTAAFVVGLLASGTWMDRLIEARDPQAAQILPIHASFGLTVLALTIARIALRIFAPPPKLPGDMAGWEKLAARVTHGLFYALLVLMPLSGWVVISTSPNIPALSWFGLFEIPQLPEPPDGQGAVVSERVAGTHGLLANVMMALIIVHVAAALRHALVLKDGTLGRMLPGKAS